MEAHYIRQNSVAVSEIKICFLLQKQADLLIITMTAMKIRQIYANCHLSLRGV